MAKLNNSNKKHANSTSSKSRPGKKSSEAKSFFRVDDNRASKAKKNKAFVKFNKSKIQANNQEKISHLNRNLDSIRTTARTFQKVESQFVNPVKEANKEYDKISEDLNAAIDKMTHAL